jgi:hypothetical protein
MFKRAALLSVLTLFGVLAAGAAAGAGAASPALAAINLSPSPAALEFGEVDLHFGGSPQQTVTFSQIALGEPTTIVESVNIAGAEASSFQVTSDGCSGAELENGKSCSIEVAFHSASAPGAHGATLELLTNEGIVEVPLSGSSITGTLSASPSPLTFSPIPYTAPGSLNEGENNETESLNIENSSNASTQVQSANITGPDASSYSIQWNCNGNTIGTNGTCTMGIRFQPTSPGPKSASLEIVSDSASSPLAVPLTGEGLHGPHMTLNTTQALLGPVALGSSVEQTFDVSNTGDYPLFIQRTFLVTGTPLMFPISEDTCTGAILYPSEACAVHISFAPTTTGEKSGALLFITNTPAINVAGIDGVGIADEAATAVVTESGHSHSPAAALATTTQTLQTVAPPAPKPGVAPGATRPPALVNQGPLRLYSLLGRTTLDPGADVQCPADTNGCEALSFIVASGRSHRSAIGFGRTPALLGSALAHLRAGQSIDVRIPLTRHAIARLRQRGRLYVRVGVVLQSGGAIVAQQTSLVKLTKTGSVSRIL